jgi:hypothetical protein
MAIANTRSPMHSSVFELPTGRALIAFVVSVTAAGAAAITLAGFFGSGSGNLTLIAGLVIAGAVSERFKVGLFGDAHVSLAAVAMMAAGLIGGARDVVIVAPLIAIAVNVGGVVPFYKTAFNVAAYTLASLAFLGTVRLAGATPLTAAWPQSVVAATVGTAVYFALNTALIATAVSIASGNRFADVIRGRYLWLLPHYLPLGALAASLAHAYDPTGAWSIAIFAAPVAAVQFALYQYASLRRTNAASLREIEERMRLVEAELTLARTLDGAPDRNVA